MKKLIETKIIGLTPLMMAAFKDQDLTTSGRKAKKALSKIDTAESYTYRDEKGKLYVPSACLWTSFVNAGRYVIYSGKQKISTRDSSILPIGLRILEENLYLNQDKYEIDERSGVVPATGGRIMIYRPKFNKWELDFTLEIDITEFSLDTIKELIRKAGTAIGLLSYRPASKGWFGTFELTKFDVLEEK